MNSSVFADSLKDSQSQFMELEISMVPAISALLENPKTSSTLSFPFSLPFFSSAPTTPQEKLQELPKEYAGTKSDKYYLPPADFVIVKDVKQGATNFGTSIFSITTQSFLCYDVKRKQYCVLKKISPFFKSANLKIKMKNGKESNGKSGKSKAYIKEWENFIKSTFLDSYIPERFNLQNSCKKNSCSTAILSNNLEKVLGFTLGNISDFKKFDLTKKTLVFDNKNEPHDEFLDFFIVVEHILGFNLEECLFEKSVQFLPFDIMDLVEQLASSLIFLQDEKFKFERDLLPENLYIQF